MKYITLILMLFSLAGLSADPIIYPTTTLAENFGATWCGACAFALAGLDVVAADTNNSELVAVRLLTESGAYSTAEIDARFSYYDVLGLPAVIFNGKTRVDGSGDGIADGSRYHEALNSYRYLGSPLKMEMASFVAASGSVSLSIKLLNPDLFIADASLVYYLVEDNVDADLTHILRDLVIQDFSMAYTGNEQLFEGSFTVDPAWNASNLWAVAFVQLDNKSILQSVSSLPTLTYQVQAALPFDTLIQGPAGGQYESPAFYIYNLGEADTFTRQIEVISAPSDWYFNYCDVDGNCYPGTAQIPFSLTAGAYVAYDLNLSIGSEGTGIFNFVISSANLGEYKIPFTYSTGTANGDLVASAELISVRSHPNPFADQLSFELDSAKAGHFGDIEIFNLKGQKVQSIPLCSLNQGISSIALDTKDLPNGVYFYKVQGLAKAAKILKIR